MVKKRFAVGGCGLLLAALLVGGCAPAPGPTPTASPSPSASPTPTENAQERRQRLDFEAAKKAYLTAGAELGRLAMKGGTTKATKILRATTMGEYQRVQMADMKYLYDRGWHADRPAVISVSATGGWSPKELQLTACEDATKVRLLDERGREVAEDRDRRLVQELTATKVDGTWKISSLTTKTVETFANEPGCMP